MPKPQRSPSLMRISTVLYLSSAAGLLSSGYLTDRFNWRLIFLPNLLYAAGAVCLLLRYYPTVPPPAPSRVARTDLAGHRAAGRRADLAADRAQSRSRSTTGSGRASSAISRQRALRRWDCFCCGSISPQNRAPLLDLVLVRDRRVMSAILIGLFTGMILSGKLVRAAGVPAQCQRPYLQRDADRADHLRVRAHGRGGAAADGAAHRALRAAQDHRARAA